MSAIIEAEAIAAKKEPRVTKGATYFSTPAPHSSISM